MERKIDKLLNISTKLLRIDVRYFGKGAAWLSSGQVIITLLTIISAVAFANLLPQEIFGHYRYILSIFAILELATLSGMNISLVRAASRGYEKTFTAIFKRKVLWGLVGSLGAIILAVYYFVNNNPFIGTSLIICAFFIPFSEPMKLYNSILHARRNYSTISILHVVTQIVSITSLVIAMFFSNNLHILLVAYFLPATISHTLIFIYTLKKRPLTGSFDKSAITYGYHMSFLKGIGSATGHVQNLFLFHFLGPAGTALFYFANAPIEQVRSLLKHAETLLLPKTAQKDWQPGSLRSFFWKITPFLFILVVGTILYIVITPLLFKTLFPKYEEAIFFSQLYAPTIIFTAINTILFTIIKSKGWVKTQYVIGIIDSVIILVLCIPSIAYFGIIGLIMAILLSKIIQTILLVGRLFIYPKFSSR